MESARERGEGTVTTRSCDLEKTQQNDLSGRISL